MECLYAMRRIRHAQLRALPAIAVTILTLLSSRMVRIDASEIVDHDPVAHAQACRVCDKCHHYNCDLCGITCGCASSVGCDTVPPGVSVPNASPTINPQPFSSPSITRQQTAGGQQFAGTQPTTPPTTQPFETTGDSPQFDINPSASIPTATLASLGDENMIGDFFGGGVQATVFIPNTIRTNILGEAYSAGPSTVPAALFFDVPPSFPAGNLVDLFSEGTGRDTTGNGVADTFDIGEPSQPTDAPTSPGPTFTFDGGTATHPQGSIGEFWDIDYSYTERIRVNLPLVPGGGTAVVGRMKIAENASPLPRDRVFFNYSLFDNVPLAPGGVTVNRFAPGFEKTFGEGLFSFELRAPFAATLDTNLVADSDTQFRDVEYGDLFLSLKALLIETEKGAISAGLSVTAPTADDTSVSLVNQRELLRIQHESVHLMPFIGWLLRPNDKWFAHGFFQIDVDTNGNTVLASPDGVTRTDVGKLRDITFLYVDAGIGYRAYQNPNANFIRAFTPTAELHWNRSLEAFEPLIAGPLQIGEHRNDIQILNAVFAGTFRLKQSTSVSVGYATPLASGADEQFDGELRVLWNRWF